MEQRVALLAMNLSPNFQMATGDVIVLKGFRMKKDLELVELRPRSRMRNYSGAFRPHLTSWGTELRVFQNEHPGITIQYVNANEEVDSMIKRGLANRNS
jgi:hypothetical protein